MINKCKICGNDPKMISSYPSSYTNGIHKMFCSCGNHVISEKSIYTAKIEWNKENPKAKKEVLKEEIPPKKNKGRLPSFKYILNKINDK